MAYDSYETERKGLDRNQVFWASLGDGAPGTNTLGKDEHGHVSLE